MSEYQYYEFVAIDRRLDASAQRSLREMSSRAQITATSFINSYHWGDLRGEPRTLIERYFDAFLYLANWGTRRVMFRLPATLLDLDTAQQYCGPDQASRSADSKNVIIELRHDPEDGGGYWEDEAGEGHLSSIIPARDQLASGDLRLLYLGWLLSAQTGELEDDDLEPPVPPNLGHLDGPLSAVVDFLKIDPDLLAVAAETSTEVAVASVSEAELSAWVLSLPMAEKDAILLRALAGDTAQLSTELLRRFRGPQLIQPASAQPARSVGELMEKAQDRYAERERLTAERLAEERRQQEREAAIARQKHLADLSAEGEPAWQRALTLIATMKPREYDLAVELLRDLGAVAEQEITTSDYTDRIIALRAKYHTRPALMRRFDEAGLPRSG